MSFYVTLPYSTTSSTCNILFWILVSHPDDVIIVSVSSSLDANLDDQFIHPPTEQILQLISNIKHKPTKYTRSIKDTSYARRPQSYTRVAQLTAQLQ